VARVKIKYGILVTAKFWYQYWLIWNFGIRILVTQFTVEHNIASKRNSMTSRPVECKSREVSLTSWDSFLSYFHLKDESRISR